MRWSLLSFIFLLRVQCFLFIVQAFLLAHFHGRGLDAFHTIHIIGRLDLTLLGFPCDTQWLLFWLCSHVLWFCHLCCCGYKFGSFVLTFVEVSIVQRSEPVALADKPEQSRNEVVNVAQQQHCFFPFVFQGFLLTFISLGHHTEQDFLLCQLHFIRYLCCAIVCSVLYLWSSSFLCFRTVIIRCFAGLSLAYHFGNLFVASVAQPSAN